LPARQHSARGYFAIAAAAFCWGVSATLGRAAFTGRLLPGRPTLAPVDPLILSQTRVTFAFLVFLAVLLGRRGGRRLRLPGPDFGRMLLLGVLGVAASNYFYYLAIARTNVAIAIMVQYTAPVWVVCYMAVRRLQRPTLSRLAAVALVVTGIALVIGGFGRNGQPLDRMGLLAALLTAFSFAFYNVGAHSLLGRYDHWMVLLYMTGSASLFWIVVNPPWKVLAEHYSGEQWLFLLLFSVVSLLVPFSLYIVGLGYLDPTRAVVVSCLEPVFSVVIAALVLHELVHPRQMFGMILVLVAIVVVQTPDRRSDDTLVVEPIE
jgi:drug/metabolite transporter, DME family